MTLVGCAFGQTVKRVEPLSWWTNMKTPLQIMFYGDDLAGCDLTVKGDGLKIKAIHKADSKNYLFVDVDVVRAGDYTFQFRRGGGKLVSVAYHIAERREGSAQRGSFSSADLIYLVMPDRFANGDPSNDNAAGTAEKVDRNEYFGRHGGDIQGLIDHLDYMQDLGVTALWATPVLLDNEPKESYHGYACADYYHVDPRLGTNDLYRELVAEIHKRGMKMIMDMVTNHCGAAHWWMQDLPFNDWINQFATFTRTKHTKGAFADPNGSQYDRTMLTSGWFDTPMPDMNLRNPYVLQYFKQVAVWWIEWANLDGLRVDTYPYNDIVAMPKWTNAIRNEYPNINIVGECWSTSPVEVAWWDGATVNRDGYNSGLPAVMDFPLMGGMTDALKDDTDGKTFPIQNIYNVLIEDFVYTDPRRLLIMLANHDTPRLADLMKQDPKKVELALALLATMRGIPQMYVGDELMFVSKDVKFGHGSARIDFPGGWKEDKVDLFDSTQRSAAQNDVFDYARKLFNWRKTADVVHNGRTLHFFPSDNCYTYFRYDNKNVVMVVINAMPVPEDVEWVKMKEITATLKEGKDVITGKKVVANQPLTVDAGTAMIVEFTR